MSLDDSSVLEAPRVPFFDDAQPGRQKSPSQKTLISNLPHLAPLYTIGKVHISMDHGDYYEPHAEASCWLCGAVVARMEFSPGGSPA